MMTLTEKWKMEGLKKGLEEGLQQGLILDAQDSIIEILETKFEFVSEDLKNKVKSINDLNILKDLRKKAVKVNTIEDFYKILIQE